MNKQLHVGESLTATVAFKDKAGNSADVVGAPTWSVDQVALLSVKPADDGLSAAVEALDIGRATITVVAEGDPTPGVDTITISGTVDIVDEASSGTLTFTDAAAPAAASDVTADPTAAVAASDVTTDPTAAALGAA